MQKENQHLTILIPFDVVQRILTVVEGTISTPHRVFPYTERAGICHQRRPLHEVHHERAEFFRSD